VTSQAVAIPPLPRRVGGWIVVSRDWIAAICPLYVLSAFVSRPVAIRTG
jgi:hypothetical protein